jgi:hypothetical protein
VHCDNEVHLGKMNKKVHLAKMHRLYVRIRKNHMDQIKKNKKVHLAEMHFFVLFFKVGLFAPALVNDIVIPSFFPCPPPVPPTHHNTQPTSHTVPMPPKEAKSTKNWGQADRDLLADLTNRQLINITDTSYQNIEQVRDLHFRHRDKKNFRKNLRNYLAAWTSKLSIAARDATEVRCGI